MTLWEMAYGKGHMFYILFYVVLLTIAVAGAEQPNDLNVSGSNGLLLVSSRTVGFHAC